jgi:hypothetical protein
MAEAINDISPTESILSGAMAWIRRAASELIVGDME